MKRQPHNRYTEITRHESCNDTLEQLVLGLVDGTLQDEDKREQAREHIGLCDHCRDLVADYHLAEEALEEVQEQGPLPFIEAYFHAGRLQAGALCQPVEGAAVMDGHGSDALESKVEGESGAFTLVMLPEKNGITLSLEETDTPIRQVTITGSGGTRSHLPDNGRVLVRNLNPGTYMISVNGRSLASLKLTGE
jgi:hypothetical protein